MRYQSFFTMPDSSSSFLGQDLSGDHPVSFTVTEQLISANNAEDVGLRSLGEMRRSPVARLDSEDRVQCTSCHDAHSDRYGKFLLSPNLDELCLGCHF